MMSGPCMCSSWICVLFKAECVCKGFLLLLPQLAAGHHEQPVPFLCKSIQNLCSHWPYSLSKSWVLYTCHCAFLSSRPACCKKKRVNSWVTVWWYFCKIFKIIHPGLGYFLTDNYCSYRPSSVAKCCQTWPKLLPISSEQNSLRQTLGSANILQSWF